MLVAVVALPVAALALRRVGLQRLQARVLASAPRRRRRPSDPSDLARRTAWAVEFAARRGPWRANCLQRSIVLWWYLRWRGLDGDLRIGVRRRPGATDGRSLDFHAWVEHGGVVLNDAAHVREHFATFDVAIAPTGHRWR